MSATDPKLVLMVLVDALRPDYVFRTRHLRHLAATGATGALRECFGFVPRAAYFGGLAAAQYGFTNMYCHDPVASPFSIARALPATSAGAAAERQVGLRTLIESAARDRLPAFAKAYASTIEIPFRFLPCFDLVEKRAPWDRAVGYASLFARLDALGLPWYQCSWPDSTRLSDPSDDGIVRQTLRDLRPDHRFAYVHLQELDGIGHQHGPNSEALQQALDRTDRRCHQLIETLRGRYPSLDVLVFGDHGMVNVTRTLDLAPILDQTGLHFGADFAYFLDSTMARFWFHHVQARETIERVLADVDGGRLLREADLRQYGIAGCDPRNAELIFLADPGVLIFPNFFQSGGEPIKGMHGYAPDCPDNLGYFLLHRSGKPELAGQALGIVDPPAIFPTLCELLEMAPQSSAALAPAIYPRSQTLPGQFTCDPNPAAEAAIQAQLGAIIQAVRTRVGQPDAIVLTGSFGRGEGGVFQDAEGRFRPVNDYDLLVIDRRDLQSTLQSLGPELARQLGIDFVDLGCSDGQWAQWPLTVFNYDLKYGSQVLDGDPSVLDRLPNYASAELPPYEAVKLLLNRSAGILSGLRGPMLEGEPPTDEERRYLTNQIVKAWMAVGDWHLIRWQGYDSSYRLRRQRLEWLGPGAGLPKSTVQKISAAYEFKCRPDYTRFQQSLEEIAMLHPVLCASLLPAINWLAETHARALSSAMTEYLAALSSERGWVEVDNAACRERSDLREIFQPHPQSAGSIRHLVYAVVPLLMAAAFNANRRDTTLAEIRGRLEPVFQLPESADSPPEEWEQLRALVVRAWFALCH